ncbi:hypothetical protein Pan161_02400 [Gimesia algae]|uniref:Uncharacterized protein n=1 Tax=Gimesia algae TaxID=2527971 RepID=A0A517V6I3_9PLAN|nr:hypothetical protein Pan161_02400 [Gimesia algae]
MSQALPLERGGNVKLSTKQVNSNLWTLISVYMRGGLISVQPPRKQGGEAVLLELFDPTGSWLRSLDCVQFYCSVSKAIWTEYTRLRDAMVKCDAL